MTRRIVLAVLILVAAVIGVVAVPLGVLTASQDTRSFRDEAVTSAMTLANVAEERLDDGAGIRSLDRTVRQLSGSGDLVSVYNRAGRRIAGTAQRPAATATQLTRATATGATSTYPGDDRLVVVTPIVSDSGKGILGTTVLSRRAAAVSQRIAVLWGVIAAVAAAGLVAAALVALALARWVNLPLTKLDAAAQSLGDGDLSARSPAGEGPAEVRRLADNFNLMAARLEALVRGHQATMADVSHQLRTPLAALRLRLDVLAQDTDAGTAAELAGAQEEIARLSRLVNGLLAVARAENVATPQVNLPVDEVITARVAAWRPAAEEHGVSVQTGLEPVAARMAEGHLEQILDNLIANALDVLSVGGLIRITAEAAGDRVKIVVADNGPGMSAQQQQVAFRRFATSNGGGTGLGLAIVDRLTAASGGSAVLSDTPGGGLTVTIELPLARGDRVQRRLHLPGSLGGSDLSAQLRRPRRAGSEQAKSGDR
jgi:signal transduction histidine kinase